MNITKDTKPYDLAIAMSELGMSASDIAVFGLRLMQSAANIPSYGDTDTIMDEINSTLAKLTLATGKSQLCDHIYARRVREAVCQYDADLDVMDLLQMHVDKSMERMEVVLDEACENEDACVSTSTLIESVAYRAVHWDNPPRNVWDMRERLAYLLSLLPHPYGYLGVAE